jgi:hypothetical protein
LSIKLGIVSRENLNTGGRIMKKQTIEAIVYVKERAKSDVNGNPRFYVILETQEGRIKATTGANGYGNYKEGSKVDVTWHYTQSYRTVIDRISEPKK